jgi:hypothetical protein
MSRNPALNSAILNMVFLQMYEARAGKLEQEGVEYVISSLRGVRFETTDALQEAIREAAQAWELQRLQVVS